MNNYLLSIAIPTYNRINFLNSLLKTLLKQINKRNLSIEIVISDNFSNDGTEGLILEFSKKYKFIKYYKNESNFGPDINMYLAIKRSNGKFVWLLGDDDLVKENAVKKIYETIKSNIDVSLFFINRKIVNIDLSKVFLEKDINESEDIIFENGIDLAYKFYDKILTCSCLVFNKKFVFGEFSYNFFYGLFLSPLVFSIECLSKGKGYFIEEALVLYREGDKSLWINFWPEIYSYNVPYVFYNAKKYFQLKKRFKISNLDKRMELLQKFIINKKNKREFNFINFEYIFIFYHYYFNYWRYIFWLCLAPSWVYYLIRKIKDIFYFGKKLFKNFLKKILKTNYHRIVIKNN